MGLASPASMYHQMRVRGLQRPATISVIFGAVSPSSTLGKEYKIPVRQIEGLADAIADMWRPLALDIHADNFTAWLWGDRGNALGSTATDYKFIHASELADRHQTWVKVPAIKEALLKYKFVVFADADALFNQPDVPLEWMLNYWNVHPKTLVAMAEDPTSPTNQDPKVLVGRLPRRPPVPRLQRWAHDWAHEQAAFGHHLRYAWNKTDDLRAIACMDANGAHHCGDASAIGIYVSHHWGKKDEPIQDLWPSSTRAVTRYARQDRPDLIFKAFINPIRPPPNWAFYDEMLRFDEA
ncbi:hypothetical protein EV126DRAFT_507804 [Verticillium dahliae]|nr:hypothetical protein EV126DRAFT_507804 [Verticillium dahliae]